MAEPRLLLAEGHYITCLSYQGISDQGRFTIALSGSSKPFHLYESVRTGSGAGSGPECGKIHWFTTQAAAVRLEGARV